VDRYDPVDEAPFLQAGRVLVCNPNRMKHRVDLAPPEV